MFLTNIKPIEPGKYKNGILVTPAYNPLVHQLKPLDIFLSSGSNFLSKGIQFVTSHQSSDREAKYNHAGIFPDGSACTLESIWTLNSNNFFDHYEGMEVLIARWNKMTPEKALHALKKTNKHIGQWYPTRRIFLHLLNLAHVFHWTNSLVCSEYVAKNLFLAGARHYHYYGTTPDALADEIQYGLNKERTGPKYTVIFEGRLPINIYKYCPNCKTVWLIPQSHQICPTCHDSPLITPTCIFTSKIPNFELYDKMYNYNQKKLGTCH